LFYGEKKEEKTTTLEGCDLDSRILLSVLPSDTLHFTHEVSMAMHLTTARISKYVEHFLLLLLLLFSFREKERAKVGKYRDSSNRRTIVRSSLQVGQTCYVNLNGNENKTYFYLP
jgi:hypothetical protein